MFILWVHEFNVISLNAGDHMCFDVLLNTGGFMWGFVILMPRGLPKPWNPDMACRVMF